MIFAAACADDPQQAPPLRSEAGPDRAVSPGVPAAGPHPPLVFEVGPLAPGLEVSVVARNLWPGENLYLTWSTAGRGRTCPPELAGACLDLAAPEPWVGPFTADLSTTSTGAFEWAVEEGPVWLQVVALRHDGTVAASDVVARPVNRPEEVWVGDGPPPPGVRAITGDWVVDPTAATIEAPGLEHIGGDWVVWSSVATAVSLPDLVVVGGAVSLYDTPGLSSIGAPALHTVGGSLSVNRMEGLTALPGLDALERVTGTLTFVDNPALSQCAISALVDRIEVGAVVCGGNLDDGCVSVCSPADTGP